MDIAFNMKNGFDHSKNEHKKKQALKYLKTVGNGKPDFVPRLDLKDRCPNLCYHPWSISTQYDVAIVSARMIQVVSVT